MKENLTYFILYLVIFLFTACSISKGENAEFVADAERYCKVHSMDYWQADGRLEKLNSMNGIEKQAELTIVIRASINTPEMQELIFVKGGALPAKELYPFLQKTIPDLTGKPFICPAILVWLSLVSD